MYYKIPKDKLNSPKIFASLVGLKMKQISIWELHFLWKLIEEMKMQICTCGFLFDFLFLVRIFWTNFTVFSLN